jgi:hypothetical protein
MDQINRAESPTRLRDREVSEEKWREGGLIVNGNSQADDASVWGIPEFR